MNVKQQTGSGQYCVTGKADAGAQDRVQQNQVRSRLQKAVGNPAALHASAQTERVRRRPQITPTITAHHGVQYQNTNTKKKRVSLKYCQRLRK